MALALRKGRRTVEWFSGFGAIGWAGGTLARAGPENPGRPDVGAILLNNFIFAQHARS